ncbi:MAG: LAGLIDADG family homing endonuclease [Patescibacteria group bacterium]
MSKNASSGSDSCRKPGNPQETLKEDNFYYAGFFAAEMTCSVIKAANYNPAGHYYYAIDITVTNKDRSLLQNVNEVVMKGGGIISPVKGAFNLSARGKNRVRVVLDFLDRYPIIIGDFAKNRVALLKDALLYLEAHRGSSEHRKKIEVMDVIRKKLRRIKEFGTAKSCSQERAGKNSIGYFLAGVLDGEGSFGFKKSGNRRQPYFAVAMKDKKIIELFRKYLQHGNVRRRKDGLYHYEINHSQVLKKICKLFLTRYPLRHARQRERMAKLQRILNDYTQNPSLSKVRE